MKKSIEINEHNYKGYTELFKTKYASLEENEIIKKGLAISFAGTLIVILSFINSSLLPYTLFLFCLYEGVSVTNLVTKSLKASKERVNLIKEKYPYVDTKISKEELIKSLAKVNILSPRLVDQYMIIWEVNEEYERKLLMKKYSKSYNNYEELSQTIEYPNNNNYNEYSKPLVLEKKLDKEG